MKKLRILPIGNGYDIYLDDVKISQYVKGASIKLVAGKLASISLDIIAQIEIPEEIMAKLKETESDEA